MSTIESAVVCVRERPGDRRPHRPVLNKNMVFARRTLLYLKSKSGLLASWVYLQSRFFIVVHLRADKSSCMCDRGCLVMGILPLRW